MLNGHVFLDVIHKTPSDYVHYITNPLLVMELPEYLEWKAASEAADTYLLLRHSIHDSRQQGCGVHRFE